MAKKAILCDSKIDLLHCFFCNLMDAARHNTRDDGEWLYWCDYKRQYVDAGASCDHCEPHAPTEGQSNIIINFFKIH